MRGKMKTYKVQEAISLLAIHDYKHLSLNEDAVKENRLVTLHQDWTPKGKEIVKFRLARGKYRGNDIGTAYRDRPV